MAPDQSPIPLRVILLYFPHMVLSLNAKSKLERKGLQASAPLCGLVELLTPFGVLTIDSNQYRFIVTLDQPMNITD